jgi:hypothetical protein
MIRNFSIPVMRRAWPEVEIIEHAMRMTPAQGLGRVARRHSKTNSPPKQTARWEGGLCFGKV